MADVAEVVGNPCDTDVDVELNVVAGHLNAQHGRLVDLTVRLLADSTLWQGPGVWTIERYLAWRVGVSPSRARQIAAIARRADELHECIGALRRGELSVDQLAPIAERAPWWVDAQVCRMAKNLTVTQVRRLVSEYRFDEIPHPSDDAPAGDAPDEPTESDADPATDATESGVADPTSPDSHTTPSGAEPASPVDLCLFYTGDDDRFRLSLETDALTGSLIVTALTEARDRLFHDGQDDVDWVDAMREVAERSIGAIEPSRRDRHRINLHLDTSGTATDATGWVVPDVIRRHLTCDGVLAPTFVADGVPVSVGRRQHIVPERTRRLVIHRDHGCRVPGCGAGRFLEIHHIIHWLDGGPSDTWNLVALCPRHHRLHHSGQLGISGDADAADGVTFTFANGARISMSGARPEPPGAPPPTPGGVYQHPLGERLDGRWVYFNPPPGHHN